MAIVELPEGLTKLLSLQKQYPNWKQTPDKVKEEILETAFANGDFGWFDDKDYREYILDLVSKRGSDDAVEAREAEKKLKHYAKIIYDSYHSTGLKNKKETEKKLVEIYVAVEEYRAQHTKSSIRGATREVASKLGLKASYVHRKYYVMKDKFQGISLEEVKERFKLR